MIVYCAVPIRGGNTFQNYSVEIIEIVNSLKHTALSELNANFKSAVPLTDSEIFTRDTKWIDKSKVLIAEVSGASTGVGFEISYALYKKKIPVLALVNKESLRNISAMINGCSSELILVKIYKDSSDLKKEISDFIKKHDIQPR